MAACEAHSGAPATPYPLPALVQERMSATLRHAGKAMATTSFSTIFAFLANATSSFPAVCVGLHSWASRAQSSHCVCGTRANGRGSGVGRYTFGVFCAMLVLCNFIIVCLYFPTVVAVRDRYFQHKRCCFCFCLCCRPRNSKVCMLDGGLCGRDDTGWQSSTHVHVRCVCPQVKKNDDVAAPSAAVPRKANHAKDAPPQLSTIPRWFRDWYYVKVRAGSGLSRCCCSALTL